MQKTIQLPVKYLKPITFEEFTRSSTNTTTTTQVTTTQNYQFQEQTTTNFSQTLGQNTQSESAMATTSSSIVHTDGSTPETCPICIRNSQKLSQVQTETQAAATTSSSVIHTDGSTPDNCPICIRNSQKLSQTQTSTASIGAQQGLKILRRGSGITANEQNGIISTAMSIIQSGLLPLSNKTAQGVKKKLGGDWLVIVYPQGKPVDFNMTCVQGNDYLYFTIGENAFQVCRLK